ncbi:MAG TPA: carboxymuconolactone decarboxylase family protein [Rectinemataceae bacterium]|nr:carboxymuconolactone decarboxylase family protein [Rectinemataceae bacterium]
MGITERLEAMKKMGREVPRPLELLGALDEKSALAHLDSRAAVFTETGLPMKYKALVALGAAVALDAPVCILNNVKTAKEAGATRSEIMEAIAVAKFSKSSTVISNSAQALEWLFAQPN